MESRVDGRDVDVLAGRLIGCAFLGGVGGVLSLVFDCELAVGRIIRAMNPSLGAAALAIDDFGRAAVALGFETSLLTGGGPMTDFFTTDWARLIPPTPGVGAAVARL